MLRKIREKIERKMIMAAGELANSERGDTNFISILIVLGIVIVVATVFLGFKNKIVEMVNNIVSGFKIS